MSNKRKAESHSRATTRPHIMKSGDSRTDSERDSGFSDASSEHMSTTDTKDCEDSPRPGVQQQGQQHSQLAVVGGSYSNLSPMIIMNNVLLKQPGDSPPALKPWGFSPTVEVVQPVVQPVVQQPQVVFLQPVVSHQASSTTKESTSRHKRSKKYLPILKSYPKIAPHPGDSSSSSGRGTASSSSSSSCSYSSSTSSSSGSKRGSSLTSIHREHCQREKQPRSLCGGASNSGSALSGLSGTSSIMSPQLQSRLSFSTTETSASSSPASERPSSAISQYDFNTSVTFSSNSSSKNQVLPLAPQASVEENNSSGEQGFSDNEADTRRKRFCNTYNILSKSGLLDITLRTKELLRQNRRTQSDLDRLKEHTDLFFQAVRSGDTSICVKLQARLQEEDGEKEKEKERSAQTSLKAD